MKRLGIITARRRNLGKTDEEIRALIREELSEDPTCGRGPAYVQEALKRNGNHIPL